MKQAVGLSFLALVVYLLMAFAKKEPKSQSEMMQEYINAEMSERRANEWIKCYEKTVTDAERYVDSIIYRQVNFSIGDSLRTPGKPMKPARPYDTLRLDTTPIVPILKTEKG